jgi:hypothetical protein
MTTTAPPDVGFIRHQLEARLTAAWIDRCGPKGTPGDWSPAEVVDVLDSFYDDIGLHLTPTWVLHADPDNDRSFTWWGPSLHDRPSAAQAFEWIIRVYLDADEASVVSELEQLGLDWTDGPEYGESGYHRLSALHHVVDPQQKPAIPDAVVHAVALLREEAA